MKRKSKTVIRHSDRAKSSESSDAGYHDVLNEVIELLESARRKSARAVNAFITGTYWEIGRRIVECEQNGEDRAGYGKRIVELLSNDLTKRFGRGFSSRNLWYMKDIFSELENSADTVCRISPRTE